MEIVEMKIEKIGNMLILTPVEDIKFNSVYNINFTLTEKTGEKLKIKNPVITRLSPLYSDIYAVRSIIDGINIPDDVILYHIREASRFVDYMKDGMKVDESKVPFEVSQFVKYKAAYECLLRHSVHISSATGMKGSVGDVSFEQKETNKDIGSLLSTLWKEIAKWKDEVRGFKLEGRASMKTTRIGDKASPAISPIGLGFPRGL